MLANGYLIIDSRENGFLSHFLTTFRGWVLVACFYNFQDLTTYEWNKQ